MITTRYTRRDWLLAGLLSLLILALSMAHLTTGLPDWGDDHAAYIAEGIAIAEGNLDAQTRLNRFMHPTQLPAEADGERLTYVWGYPLLLSAMYRAVGFDCEAYASIFWYKLPSALCLALLAGTLYLLFRRRFGVLASAGMAVLFFAWGELFDALNILYADVVFLFFSTLTLLMMEIFLAHVGERGWGTALALVYGAAMWFTREVRLNGTAVCAAALLGHALCLWKRRVPVDRRSWWRHALPYLAVLALTLLSERLWLLPATGNASDLGRASLGAALSHAKDAARNLFAFLDSMGGVRLRFVGLALGACALVGVFAEGLGENLHLNALLIGTLAVVCLLPYSQGARYLYNILPVVLLDAALGARWIYRKLSVRFADRRRWVSRVARLLAAALVCASLARMSVSAVRGFVHRDDRLATDVYSAGAVEMYHYIRDNVPEDAVIAFNKPRALYLNTGRVCFREAVNGHVMAEADYFLHFKASLNSQDVLARNSEALSMLFENDLFELYEVR